MSNALRFNLILIGLVFTVVFATVMSVTPELNSAQFVASPYCTSPQEIPPIDAVAAYAFEIETGRELFLKNADAQLPLASLTKTVTALTASKYLDMDEYVSVSRDALSVQGESGLVLGEEWLVRDLIDFTLIESSNDGAHVLAEHSARNEGHDIDWFYQMMNEVAVLAGATQMYFLNDSGLDISTSTAGAYGSARDVALLLAFATKNSNGVLEGSTATEKSFTTRDGREHTAVNTSSVPGQINGARISKTGYTDLAGGNLGIVFDAIPGQPVVAVVLGSTREGRDAAMLSLIDAVRARIRTDAICTEYSN